MVELPKDTRPLILIGDVVEKLKELPDKSVDTIITSPPYWQQRDYDVKGQIGQESRPEEYVKKIAIGVGNELKRVLKDTGSYFLNIGDKYLGKDLQMIPFQVSLEMQKQGWVLRNVIVWYKPNHMPSSIGDRLSTTWEPVFFFVKGTGKYYTPEYYVNIDEVRIPHKTNEREDLELSGDLPFILSKEDYERNKSVIEQKLSTINKKLKNSKFRGNEKNVGASPAGRLALGIYYSEQRTNQITPELETEIIKYLRSWREKKGISPKEIDKLLNKKDTAGHWFRLDHGRSLPRSEDWLKLKTILGFDGKYDKIMAETCYVLQTLKRHPKGRNPGDVWEIPLERFSEAHFSIFPTELPKRIIKAFCPRNGIVLDPFAGSGTTGKAAMELERRSILIELNPTYKKMIEKRCGLIGTLEKII